MSPARPLQVCVTGGAGFIGSHLVDALLAAGHRVAVLDDLSTGRRENLPAGCSLRSLDIRSPEAARAVESGGFDVLFHLAAQIDVRKSVEDPLFDAGVNVLGSLNLIEAARRGGVRQVVFASTGGAIYGDSERLPVPEDHPTSPVSPYGVAKLAVERYLFSYQAGGGPDAACLRFANVYGERQNAEGEAGVVAIFLQRLLAGRRPVIHGDGLQTRDYVHVSDVVRANLAVIGRPGFAVYNIGTGLETTVVDLYEQIRLAAASELHPEHGPPKSGEQRRSAVDPRRAFAELDLPPPLPLAEGLARTAAWFRERLRS